MKPHESAHREPPSAAMQLDEATERPASELRPASEQMREPVGRSRRGFAGMLRAVRFVRRRKVYTAGLALVLFFYALAVFADFLAPYDYRAQ